MFILETAYNISLNSSVQYKKRNSKYSLLTDLVLSMSSKSAKGEPENILSVVNKSSYGIDHELFYSNRSNVCCVNSAT